MNGGGNVMDNEILHYKRGITFLKIMKEYLSYEKYSERSICEFCNWCEERVSNNLKFSMFDLNNFLVLCAVVFMGLNKESIEESDNLKDYQYDITYVWPAVLKEKPNELLEKIVENEFNNVRVIETPYDEWLSVLRFNLSSDFTPNFLFNVRNGFMHSEYNLEIRDSNRNFLFLNVKNSNYTNFEGRILVCNFVEFIKFFYSNDAYSGLVDKYFIGQSEEDDFFINCEDELDRVAQIKLLQVKYKNINKNSKKTFEKLNYGNKAVPKIQGYEVEETEISDDQTIIEQVKLLIKKYYGKEFYNLSSLDQGEIIFMMKKYLNSPSSYISEWIMHFYLNVVHAIHRDNKVDNTFKGIFAIDSTFLIIKSYLVLYRLQNKAFVEVDYNCISDFEYQYSETADYNMYDHFKQKLIAKGICCSEKEYIKRYFCEVFRNALAHGKLEVKIEMDSKNEIIHKLIFKDIYKGKIRQIELSNEALSKFLESEAFERRNAISSV